MGGKRGRNRGRPELKGAQRVGKGNKGKAHTPGAGLAQRRVRPLAARPSKVEALPRCAASLGSASGDAAAEMDPSRAPFISHLGGCPWVHRSAFNFSAEGEF